MQVVIFASFESLIIPQEKKYGAALCMILNLQKHCRKKIIKRINNRMRTPMINTIQEYLHLAANDNIQDNNKTRTEELSPAVIGEILHHYPEKKAWLVHNKHIPAEVLRLLCTDENADVRFTVAMKNKNDRYIFETLMNDPDFSIRLAIIRNKKLPIDLLKKMVHDTNKTIAQEAMRILRLRDTESS